MPATSQSQFRYMKGVQGGSIPPPDGMSRAHAGEYVAGQSPKGLPERAQGRDKQRERQKKKKKK